ncbi:ABC transporter substrate-binding protein [Scandinavium manionii]|uniref:ABC transporter substrate-binding protein n=1 Tax=Scandinavium manionii TaxID=2926520 RepID=UPI00135C3C42|nr:ABC transporter substrate-binding protein [Scandinavium manionii]MCS2147920.1 ABC transporter substrate-binding protein [Scandinavium manionii]MCS2166368.1 ABC transporter substrate-binding protein [Scandinavium manionii]
MRKILRYTLVALLTLSCVSVSAQSEPAKGGIINVAMIGEPPTLDPMVSTADLVGTITQHIFETLYTFNGKSQVIPLLANAMPTLSDDGKTYVIPLRHGVTFHNGQPMTAKDVLASLQRWEKISSRGRQTAEKITELSAPDDYTIKIVLNQPYAPMLALLSLNNSAAVIMPEAQTTESPLTTFIGTGPYQLKSHQPDRFIQLVRFVGYHNLEGAPDGYGGARKQYLDEIRFVPVTDPNTRVEGAISGQFEYVDSLPVESFNKIQGGKDKPVLLKPYGWPVFVMNTKQGVASNILIRKAIQAALAPQDMMTAAFGSPEFFTLDGAMYPKGNIWHTEEDTSLYRSMGDTAKAQQLLKQANYQGQPLRILTSRQYEFHYKLAQVAQAYLEAAGFKVQLDVQEWASLTQNRANPARWDMYISHSPFLPEPSLTGIMSDTSPGWWSTDKKHAALQAFNSETDPQKRIALWANVQKAIYEDVPMFKVGNFNALAAQSPRLQGVTPAPWPYFWNAYLTQ